MSDDPEPSENLAGPTGTVLEESTPSNPSTRAEAIVDRLGELYWRKAYGGRDAFDCLIRTILSQNTSDVASQPAHDALRDRFAEADFAQALATATTDEIISPIKPAGLYNQKAAVIRAAAERVCQEFGGEAPFDEFVAEESIEAVRETLLSFDGVGPKTADCVLLFAGGRDGIFPVDTHVHRIARRLGIAPAEGDPEAVRQALETGAIPPEKCGFGHTALIQFGREYCTAQTPACLDGPEACPLFDCCDQVGVDIDAGTVIDPADAASEEA